MPISRRTVIKLLGAGAATLYLDMLPALAAQRQPLPAAGGAADFGPIDRTLGDRAPGRFSGDDPERAHRVLRERENFLAPLGGNIPPAEKRVPLVVVGGGIGGLFTAYLLRRHRPVLLEQAARFGGNSKGESWRGLDYSIGAAYFVGQEQGSALHRLYLELGLDRIWRRKPPGHPVELLGQRHERFWEGQTAPKSPRQFRLLQRYLRNLLHGRNGLVFPEIPATTARQRRQVDALDRVTLRGHLETVLGGAPLHPHLSTSLEHYCWSSFGAASSELSAAAGLNFLASEFGEILVAPGGNAAVAERIVDRLAAALPPEHLQTGAVVFRVQAVQDGVEVGYEDASGALRSLHARAVVLACPKFVVAKILEGIEPQRLASIGRLRYRGYLVANVLLRRPIADSFYDLYLLGNGAADVANIKASAQRQRATDVVFGTYAQPDGNSSVLTLYRGLPYDEGRSELYAEGAYEKYRGEFEEQVSATVLPLLGLRRDDVADLRIARWGHPLPVAAPGLIADGTVDWLRRPFGKRVFFVEQDNWALPALETAATEATLWAPEVERLLRRRVP